MDWKAAKVATLVLGGCTLAGWLLTFMAVNHPIALARFAVGLLVVVLWLAVYHIFKSNRDNTLW